MLATLGYETFRSIDLDESEEAVKTTAGSVHGWFIKNQSASARYIKLYDATVATTVVGTTTPKLTISLEPYEAANVEYQGGIVFATAITAAATTGLADADTGAPSANDVVVNIFYK